MTALAIEVTEEEARHFHDAGIECTEVKGSNFDGDLISTILISLTSAATIKAVMPVLLEIVKSRKSSTIKVNGMEIKNVSEQVVLEALKRRTPSK
jgi:hypothetical protein